ncbi:hypothetical protein C8Q73DRAFT_792569 [Cubamyces lactineus]|nr:hypothetical protein C8Q73DRAFT_792569 [Cubamyces lactineus]
MPTSSQGVTAQRLTNPSLPLDQLPPIHLVLLSHYHEDHFDRLVEDRFRRDPHIVTIPPAQHHLTAAHTKGELFTAVTALDTWQAADIHATGWSPWSCPTDERLDGRASRGTYISGDTLIADDLKTIPDTFPRVDLMLIHLGRTSIQGPIMPLLLMTMDAAQARPLESLFKKCVHGEPPLAVLISAFGILIGHQCSSDITAALEL